MNNKLNPLMMYSLAELREMFRFYRLAPRANRQARRQVKLVWSEIKTRLYAKDFR